MSTNQEQAKLIRKRKWNKSRISKIRKLKRTWKQTKNKRGLFRTVHNAG